MIRGESSFHPGNYPRNKRDEFHIEKRTNSLAERYSAMDLCIVNSSELNQYTKPIKINL